MRERLFWERWRRNRLKEAEVSEQSKCVETIPHVDKLYICYIEKKLCTGSG